jgi:hypothetical protein
MNPCHKWLAEQGKALQELPEGNPIQDIRVIINENMKPPTYSGKGCKENTTSNSSSTAACLFVDVEMCCLAMAASSCSTIPAFSHHVTLLPP